MKPTITQSQLTKSAPSVITVAAGTPDAKQLIASIETTETESPAPRIVTPDAEVARLHGLLAVRDAEIARLQAEILKFKEFAKKSDIIILRGNEQNFSVMVDTIRHRFTNYELRTTDRNLVNKILRDYPNIIEVSNDQI